MIEAGLLLQQLHRLIMAEPGPILVSLACLLIVLLVLYGFRVHQLKAQLVERTTALGDANEQLAALQENNQALQVREARLLTLIRSERRSATEKLTLLEEAREELRLQFSDLAQEIFDQKSQTFSSQSRERLESLLKPLQLQLDSLQREIKETYQNNTRERSSLRQEIQQLQEQNRRISEEAINLSRALKGDRKLQGTWGELVLERVLEESGLRQGVEYVTQRGLRSHDNRLYKPDVIIRLPQEKDIIVDAKVSLSAWERLCSTDSEHQQRRELEALVRAIRSHLESLSTKAYEELRGVRSLDFVLMFMPIEAAFAAATRHDTRLLQDGFNQKVIIVTPTTLLATLRTVENLWRYEHQSRNSLEIARRAGALYDKFVGFTEDMERIGKQLATCQHTYDGAMSKLSMGRGNLVSQAHHLTELGVQAKKELSKTMTAESSPQQQ